MKRWSAAVLTVAALVACDSAPLRPDQQQLVPVSRVLAPERLRPAGPGEVLALLTRDHAPEMAFCAAAISVNGVRLVELRQGEVLSVAVPAGRQRWKIEMGGGLCPPYVNDAELDAPPGDRLQVRVRVLDMRLGLDVQPLP